MRGYITARDLAAILGIHQSTFAHRRGEWGLEPAETIGAAHVFWLSDVRRLIRDLGKAEYTTGRPTSIDPIAAAERLARWIEANQ